MGVKRERRGQRYRETIRLEAARVNLTKHVRKTRRGSYIPKRDMTNIITVDPARWRVSDCLEATASVGSMVVNTERNEVVEEDGIG